MAVTSNITEIIFLGLSQSQHVQKIIFVMFLLMYIAIVLGNGLIVVTIMASKGLSSPMYFFLSYLSLVEGCITQIFFLHFFGGTEIFLLTVMAYDRYVAICKPLHYVTIMNRKVCGLLVGAAWSGGLLHSAIDHYFCDVHPVLKLACSDTFLISLLVIINGGSISVISFAVLLASYVVILHSLRSHTAEGRRRALSTCASHLAVVGLFFIPCSFVYMRPCTTFSVDKIVAVFYTVVTPLLNPIIYSFRNTEVKNAMKRLAGRKTTWEEK
ncbi:Olfactory receptor 4X1 [Lemmus lemmus]